MPPPRLGMFEVRRGGKKREASSDGEGAEPRRRSTARRRGKREEPLSWAHAHHSTSMYLCLLHVESGVCVAKWNNNVRDTHTEVSFYATATVRLSRTSFIYLFIIYTHV